MKWKPTLGLGEDAAQPRKKTTSFKITNVFPSRPPSNDGDVSAEELDDLEDSHTEEIVIISDLFHFKSPGSNPIL